MAITNKTYQPYTLFSIDSSDLSWAPIMWNYGKHNYFLSCYAWACDCWLMECPIHFIFHNVIFKLFNVKVHIFQNTYYAKYGKHWNFFISCYAWACDWWRMECQNHSSLGLNLFLITQSFQNLINMSDPWKGFELSIQAKFVKIQNRSPKDGT